MKMTGIVRKSIVIEFDSVEACGLLEDMNEIASYLSGGCLLDDTGVVVNGPAIEDGPWIERQFENVRSELRKLLDELDIQ